MKRRKDFEKWALPLLHKIAKVLLIDDHTPLILEPISDSASHSTAEFQFCYPYKSLTVRYADSLVKEWEKKEFEYVRGVLIHELAHAVTDPLYAKATTQWISKSEIEDERERLTDHIANIILKAGLVK